MTGQAVEMTGTAADGKIAWLARVWRQADQDAIAHKGNAQKQQAEYWARQLLRQAVDAALQHA